MSTDPKGTVLLRTTKTPEQTASLQRRFEAAVSNTGNYFFEEALLGHLADIEVAESLSALPEEVNTLVLSMSNFLSPSTDLGPLCDSLSKHKIQRFVMIGAGAQAYSYEDPLELTEGTTRFIRTISEKSVTIGVRGYYTQEILHRMGIRNTEVIGCPSAFWKGGKAIRRSDGPVQSVALHCTPSGHFRDKVGTLFKIGQSIDANYIIQSEKWMMPFLSDEFAEMEESLKSRSVAAYYARGLIDVDELVTWLRRACRIFFSMNEWIAAMEGYDLVFGNRFHGNMAAIQAGTPALNMPFDTRTRELCEYLNLPHIPFTKLMEDMTKEKLRESADFSLYEKTYPLKLEAYREFLQRNGLRMDTSEILTSEPTQPDDNSTIATKLSSCQRILDDCLRSGISLEKTLSELELRVRDERSIAERKHYERGDHLNRTMSR